MAAVMPMPSNPAPMLDAPATYPSIHNISNTSPPNGNKTDAEAALEFDYASVFTDDLDRLSREGKITHTFAATVHISSAIHLYTHLKLSTPAAVALHGTGSAWSTSIPSGTYDGRVDVLEYDALVGGEGKECRFMIDEGRNGALVVRFVVEGRMVAMFTGRGRGVGGEGKGDEEGEEKLEGEFRWSWTRGVVG